MIRITRTAGHFADGPKVTELQDGTQIEAYISQAGTPVEFTAFILGDPLDGERVHVPVAGRLEIESL